VYVRKTPFAAVRNKHPRGYELPKEKDTTPNEGDGHNGLWSRTVAWISCRHRKDVTGPNTEVGENIRENSKLPPLLEVMFSRRRVDFQKISSESVVDLRGWRSL
jgi:hypothetical protein